MDQQDNEKVEDEKDDKRKELFSQKMRAATRNIHNKSDALVNAKLGVTMSDDNVWAEGCNTILCESCTTLLSCYRIVGVLRNI